MIVGLLPIIMTAVIAVIIIDTTIVTINIPTNYYIKCKLIVLE